MTAVTRPSDFSKSRFIVTIPMALTKNPPISRRASFPIRMEWKLGQGPSPDGMGMVMMPRDIGQCHNPKVQESWPGGEISREGGARFGDPAGWGGGLGKRSQLG